MAPRPTLIGRRELVDLPDLGVSGIEAKTDTGAFRTAIHCESCREIDKDGHTVLEAIFNLDGKGEKIFFFTNYSLRTIRNSFSQTEQRYCIRTVIRIGRKDIRSDISLTNRSGMKYQVLLGRKTIGRKFHVDVSRVFCLRKNRKS